MELRLIGRVAMLRSHGTGAAGATAVISAVGAFQTVEMGDAGRDIISGWKKAFTGMRSGTAFRRSFRMGWCGDRVEGVRAAG